MDMQLANIFRKTLNLSESIIIKYSDSPQTLSSWDSIGHLNLIANAQLVFNIDIEPEDILPMMENIAAFFSIISDKLNKSSC